MTTSTVNTTATTRGSLSRSNCLEIGTRAKLSRIARARGLRTSDAWYMKAMTAKMKSVRTIGWSIGEVLRWAATIHAPAKVSRAWVVEDLA